MESIPPTSNALLQHIKQATIYKVHLFGESVVSPNRSFLTQHPGDGSELMIYCVHSGCPFQKQQTLVTNSFTVAVKHNVVVDVSASMQNFNAQPCVFVMVIVLISRKIMVSSGDG